MAVKRLSVAKLLIAEASKILDKYFWRQVVLVMSLVKNKDDCISMHVGPAKIKMHLIMSDQLH